VVVGKALLDDRAVLAEVGENGVRALRPVEVVDVRDSRPVDSGYRLPLAFHLGCGSANADDRRARHRREGSVGRRLERREAVVRREDVAGVHLLVHRVADGAAQALAEHRDEGDQC
jgi:hypothetical protein